jgi:hypothetical protein
VSENCLNDEQLTYLFPWGMRSWFDNELAE